MSKWEKTTLLLLRLGMGWVYFYAGIVKLLDPQWSSAGYLNAAKTFPGLFQWFASSANIGWVNFLNQWGLTLIGAALLLGVAVRLASYAGALLTLLYYFPILDFPQVGAHGYLIDDHIIYVLVFGILAAYGAGRVWGLDKTIEEGELVHRFPWLLKVLG